MDNNNNSNKNGSSGKNIALKSPEAEKLAKCRVKSKSSKLAREKKGVKKRNENRNEMKTRNKRQSSEQCDQKKKYCNEEEHKLLRAKKSEQKEGRKRE